jgi:hypothetical protein
MYDFIYARLFVTIANSQQLTGEDSYQIATMGTQGIRIEIVSDGPPPPPDVP